MRLATKCSLPPILLVASALGACGTTPPENVGRVSQEISAGAATALAPYAVAICKGPSAENCKFWCSGTLIAPNLVIAARHCAYDVPNYLVDCSKDTFQSNVPPDPTQYWLSTTADLRASSAGRHGVTEIKVPTPSLVCGADLALFFLQDNVSASESTPATPALDRLTDTSKFSSTVVAIGYGETSNGVGDYGVRRIRESNPITCLPGAESLTCGEDTSYVTREFVANTGVCPGDSGSGAYDQVAFNRGEGLLVGILSRGQQGEPGCASGVYERLDVWASFVAAGGTAAATKGGYAAPAWTKIPAADGGAAQFPPHTLGASCEVDTECNSGTCASDDGGFTFVCSQSCDATTKCPNDFSCFSGNGKQLCFVDPQATPAAPPPDGGGCAMTPVGSSKATPAYTLFLLVAAFLCRRRLRNHVA